MEEIVVSLIIVLSLLSLVLSVTSAQRFLIRSWKAKCIETMDKRRTRRQVVGWFFVMGLMSSSLVSLSPNRIQGGDFHFAYVLCISGLATIGASVFGWIGFEVITLAFQSYLQYLTKAK
jgi:NhaP-type Na+/H+ or K+/H+ antiporter